MARYSKMRRRMLRVLAVMLVASFLLAIVAFALPAPAAAYCLPAPHCWTAGRWESSCGSCSTAGTAGKWVVEQYCCWQCSGTNPTCWLNGWCQKC